MNINALLKDVTILEKQIDEELDVVDISDNSKNIKEGFLFIAHQGFKVDGHDYINEAIKLGANIIVCENKEYYDKIKGNKVLVEEGRKAKAIIARNYYLNPAKEMKIIGVTGTKGKTTSTFMIKSMLDQAGVKTGLIGTIYTVIGDKVIQKNERTTPDSIELQKILRIMANENVKYVVMEVSSQALKLDRVYGISFEVGLYTNIYKEHLNKNEHGSMMEYLNEKLKLFKNSKYAVINQDDFAREYVKKASKEYKTYGIANKADFNATDINIRSTGVDFITIIEKKVIRIATKIPGRYTVFNALGSIAVVNLLGVKENSIKEGIKNVVVPGRFEIIENDAEIPVVLDFATVPESLESLLKSARLYVTGRVVSIFGCEGEKNQDKREEMGQVSGKLADITIVTTFNPRNESVDDISKDILTGIRKVNGKGFLIKDRKEAIEFALSKAQKRDMILITGLGHNKFLEINGEKVLFNEKEIIQNYFKNNPPKNKF